MLISILAIILCCVIIWRASDGFEVASEYLGRNLTEGVRGATINAIGSSMPELFTTFWFLFILLDQDGFSGGIGTTAGSAIFNGMIIPAVVILAVIGYGLAKSVTVSKKVILRDGLSLIIAEFCLILLISGTTLTWWHGLALMGIYGIYMVYMLSSMKSREGGEEEEEEEEEDDDKDGSKSLLQAFMTIDLEPLFIRGRIKSSNAWPLLITATLTIGLACFLLVYSCEWLGEALGIHYYFIAVILASAATSVPDTIISYRDAMDGEYDDAVANALGSNIFDICFALGFPLFLFTLIYGNLEMSPETVNNISELRVLLLIMTVIAFFIYYIGPSLGRFKAVLLLAIYLLFTIYILGSAYEHETALQIGEFLRSLVGR